MRLRSKVARAALVPLLRGPLRRPATRALVAIGHRYPETLPGRGALVTALVERGGDLIASLTGGVRLAVPATPSGASLYLFGTLTEEPETVRLFRASVKPGDVVLDVGAHVGFYAFLAAPLVGAAGHVHAFEPQPDLSAHLRRSVTLNGYAGRMTIESAAVTNRSAGEVALHLPEAKTASGVVSLYAHEWLGTDQIDVPSLSIDEYVREHGLERVDVVKLDIEGAELAALEGMDETLRTLSPRLLVIELSPAAVVRLAIGGSTPLHRHPDAAAPVDVAAFLRERGYEPRRILASGELGPILGDDELADLGRSLNVAFLAEGS